MHIRSEDEKEKRRSDRDKKIVLNIPVEGKKEIAQSEIYTGSSLLSYDSNDIDILQKTLNGFHLSFNGDLDFEDSSSSSSSDSEAEELQKNVVSKGPIKYEHGATRQTSKPYTIQNQKQITRRRLQSGGDLIETKPQSYTCYNLIPQSVADYVSPIDEIPVDVNQLYSELSENERRKLDEAIDLAINPESSKNIGILKLRPKDSELCNSPDSSYETMSPSSIPPPSPYSLHSPNPLHEKMRLSDLDALCDSELGTKELTLDIRSCVIIPPPPRQRTPNIIVQSRIQQPTINPVISRDPQLFKFISRPKSIQPDTEIIVHEFGLSESAADRLKKDNLVKTRSVSDQWRHAIEEAKPLYNLIEKEESRTITDYEREDIKRKKNDLRKKLIDLIKEKPARPFFYERLLTRIKLYQRNYFDILTGKDAHGYSPLHVAAVLRNDCPLIARLIIDATENIDTKLDEEENTILHYLAQLGDSHAQVLSELLYSNSNKAKINKANIMSDTALHKAVKCHSTKSCLACVKQLIKHGASLELQDFKRQTPLHLATMQSGDPLLLRALLQSSTASKAIDLLDENSNTALHIAASRNDLPFVTQKELIRCLVHSGATHCTRNKQEKFAIMLVAEDRRQEIKNIIHRK